MSLVIDVPLAAGSLFYISILVFEFLQSDLSLWLLPSGHDWLFGNVN